MTVKITFTVLVVQVALAQAVIYSSHAGLMDDAISLACEEYALNLPAIETYIGHSIPVSKYNPDALMTDLPKPLRLTRPRTGNGPRRTGAPRNRRRSG
ncbi:hypothetical protein EIMP300_08560 [Escherichia coli]|uniref:Uncharacterized protein n=1 Tax=Escherichia coli TaxID=562 RepID=A0A8S0FG81_ECOLX|nr:hypothetical protein EIMP300_08560 [Escherichia coli]